MPHNIADALHNHLIDVEVFSMVTLSLFTDEETKALTHGVAEERSRGWHSQASDTTPQHSPCSSLPHPGGKFEHLLCCSPSHLSPLQTPLQLPTSPSARLCSWLCTHRKRKRGGINTLQITSCLMAHGQVTIGPNDSSATEPE